MFRVWFRVWALPEPEPDLLEPELTVRFRVWGIPRTGPMVRLAVQPKMAKNRTELNLTITNADHTDTPSSGCPPAVSSLMAGTTTSFLQREHHAELPNYKVFPREKTGHSLLGSMGAVLPPSASLATPRLPHAAYSSTWLRSACTS
jgi:hypothetical protein